MAVLFIRFAIFKLTVNPVWDTKEDLEKMLSYFIIGITVIVVAIP
jgi:FtsH-binding integral membrane protein